MRTTTDEEVIAQRLNLEMLERPHLWPSVSPQGDPIVHVKRRQMIPALEGTSQRPFTNYRETGPCALVDGTYMVIAHDWAESGATVKLQYTSAQAVVDDGWMVD